MIESNARVGFVGAGKVGTALGELFRSCGIVVSGYSSLLAEDAQAAAEKTASDAYADAAEVVEASDVIFFTVPDGEISNAWKSLVASYGAAACDALFGKIVCHCSGALPAAVFADAANMVRRLPRCIRFSRFRAGKRSGENLHCAFHA